MPIYTNVLPQVTEQIKTTTLYDILNVLPDTLDMPINVWIADRIARFGRTTGNLIFLTDSIDEPSADLRIYFETLIAPLGIAATISNGWKDNRFVALQLYSHGRLIIDKETMTYRELPNPVSPPPVITSDAIRKYLPQSIDWRYTIYLTGGVLKNGWSANDVDMIIFDNEMPLEDLLKIRNYFAGLFNWKVDVGRKVMPEREPVYLLKIYEQGKLCQF